MTVMPVAVHYGGPADGAEVRIEQPTQTRHWAQPTERQRRGWVDLARYVFTPPRRGKWCRYDYTGQDQVRGPVAGDKTAPEWS